MNIKDRVGFNSREERGFVHMVGTIIAIIRYQGDLEASDGRAPDTYVEAWDDGYVEDSGNEYNEDQLERV